MRQIGLSKETQDYLSIINYFGLEHQLRKLDEEYGELSRAITAYVTRQEAGLPVDKYTLVTEIADVKTVLKEIMAYFEIETADVKPEMRYKLSRTLALVAEEKRKDGSEIHTSS